MLLIEGLLWWHLSALEAMWMRPSDELKPE